MTENIEKAKSLIMGLWKFDQKVSKEELVEVANEWATDPKYLQVYIRKVSKDQEGIGFAYAGNGTQEAHREYFEATSDVLKRKFGNGLVGWDIASTSTLIKGF